MYKERKHRVFGAKISGKMTMMKNVGFFFGESYQAAVFDELQKLGL